MVRDEIEVGTEYAVRTHPSAVPQRGDTRRILRATALAKKRTETVVRVEQQTVPGWSGKPRSIGPFETTVPNVSVRQVWAEYEAEQERIRTEKQRRLEEEIARYEAEQEARKEWIEGFVEAFRGIKVKPGGVANFPREDVDLADRITEDFVKYRTQAAQFTAEDLAAIAARILELNEIVRQNALVALPEPEEVTEP